VTIEENITFKRSHFFLALLPITFVLGLAAGYVFWCLQPFGGTSTVNTAALETESVDQQIAQVDDQPEEGETGQQEYRRYEVSEDDDPVLGPEDAAITLIEFSDYECPYCTRWHTEVFDRIREDYPDQVRFVYRDFPLKSIHPNAVPAAEAANCANEQDAFWEYSEKLFNGELGLNPEAYLEYATQLDLDLDEFEKCFEEGRYSQEVEDDYQYALQLGVQSTPTFFLNGIPLIGARPYEVFKDVIERELAGELP
jgi:protein-disulfide isomerase